MSQIAEDSKIGGQVALKYENYREHMELFQPFSRPNILVSKMYISQEQSAVLNQQKMSNYLAQIESDRNHNKKGRNNYSTQL